MSKLLLGCKSIASDNKQVYLTQVYMKPVYLTHVYLTHAYLTWVYLTCKPKLINRLLSEIFPIKAPKVNSADKKF